MPSRLASLNSGAVSFDGISLLEERIDFRLVRHPPARKERRERELGEHDQLAAHALGLAQMSDHALDHVAARVAALDGAHLRGADSQKTRHRHLFGDDYSL